MKSKIITAVVALVIVLLMGLGYKSAAEHRAHSGTDGNFDVKETIFEHLSDTYGWEVPFNHSQRIPLPIIVWGQDGLHCFMSSRITGGDTYEGYKISTSEKYHGKVVQVLADGSEYGQEGKWDFDDNQMSLETASIMMRLSFPNSERLLVPNSYVTLLADFKNPPRFPSVPQQSVVDLQGGNRGVWVLKDDMTVECRAVEVRESFAGWTPVTSGLAAGEKVVVSGVTKLVPGAKVSLAEATPNDDLAPGTAPKVRD